VARAQLDLTAALGVPQIPTEWAWQPGAGGVEAQLVGSGFTWVVGVDEAGRGPLAGPVTVAAFALPLSRLHELVATGVCDSKAVSATQRIAIADRLMPGAWLHSVVHVPVDVIDRLNILQATLQGMLQAVSAIPIEDAPRTLVLVDGNRPIKGLGLQQATLVEGDRRSVATAAASILAKVARDAWMDELHARHPEWGFERHKGYGTAEHLRALAAWGPLPEHRRSFAPVKNRLGAVESSAHSGATVRPEG
jgi:ribonuclease HII